MAKKAEIIQVRLDAELKADAQERAAFRQLNMTQYILGLIKDDLYGKRPGKASKRREKQHELELTHG